MIAGHGHRPISAYMAVSPGQYTVAMRGFGAPASSTPALTTSFMVSAGAAYTLAALGPDPGLRTEVLQDQMSAPAGKALVRVLQASLKENLVTVTYGSDVLARQLAFGSATSYAAVSPGQQTVQFAAAGEDAAMPVKFTAGTVHTIVALDDSSGLKVDALTDAAGSQIMPKGGAATGFGGTAAHPAPDPAPWLLMIAAGRCWPPLAWSACAVLPSAHRPSDRRDWPASETAAALRALAAAAVFGAGIASWLLARAPARPPGLASLSRSDELTTREREVRGRLAESAGNQQTARSPGISPRTVHNHVSRTVDNLHAADRTQAALRARTFHRNYGVARLPGQISGRRVSQSKSLARPCGAP
jgi:DNA-binding CsgD family transcriptional regulator